ncbi:hypothetical protein JX265_006245 [Neoarthrinium moseri]|uniref:Myb-like domain-containing protein n=1 Tax=Neoarthrinium moseri TaxID=1658444 RepID=A0A9P9WLV8_9PEZI|nr:uncharacterized protein JN550_011995 [Neoarthrinium moseri]KAI1841696.1 hypothetical protein JX266_012064 [Neoarthrinium moseri]KAI1859587.1 hypothetical protein JN550_011995 [Neoarthrinium moseri]KAI1870075.1 hypothetical protein JX265_006245 [Neoarthrinium moseri]
MTLTSRRDSHPGGLSGLELAKSRAKRHLGNSYEVDGEAGEELPVKQANNTLCPFPRRKAVARRPRFLKPSRTPGYAHLRPASLELKKVASRIGRIPAVARVAKLRTFDLHLTTRRAPPLGHLGALLYTLDKMLMPSALSCDSSHQPGPRLQSALFSSPPASPPTTAHNPISNIFSTCRALQSMLTGPATSTLNHNDNVAPQRQLPTPPMAHAQLPPLKLRLRSRKADANSDAMGRKKVVKRSAAPPRGANKRRRAMDDDMGRDDDIDSDLDIDATDNEATADQAPSGPRTPKRARLAPEVIPLGLERADFHNLQNTTERPDSTAETEEVDLEVDGEEWSTEEDRILVELILDKLKLTKTDWQDCARSLGKDRHSLGRRWKSLMVNGDVGLKSRSRRGKIHGTWR